MKVEKADACNLYWFIYRRQFAKFTHLRVADQVLGREEHLEKTVVFLVQAEALAVPDSAAAELLGKAAEAGREEARAEAALSVAADSTEAARKV